MRAWLEDVTTPQRRWRHADEAKRGPQESTRSFTKNFEYLKELAKRDFDLDVKSLAGRGFSPWKVNLPMLRSFQNVARSEILETNDRHSISKRSTKSMFEEPNYYGQRNGDSPTGSSGDDAVNAKVRKAIENSFIKQMEENAALQEKAVEKRARKEETAIVTEGGKEAGETAADESSLEDRGKRSKANSSPAKKELPDMINELPNAKNTAKRIMDAVIREMVDAKVLEQHIRPETVTDYEVDSLERSKCSRKSSTSPESTDQSSPALSTALPMDEELTMQNAVINTRTGEMMKLNKEVLERNYYNSLPELISSQRSESYSLVSEVYVNDGYDSPACSDDSGPEIQYEPENPGHLTIKVQDSPENYVKQDESEYEPDTLDRKPMKLKINDDVNYERELPDEVYVDSLERPAQILLKSKGSFRDQESAKNGDCMQRGYGSLREIYEARLKSNVNDPALNGSNGSLNGHLERTESCNKGKYLTPETRQARRQRQPSNQPDVVPTPPTDEIYQQPKPPRRVKDGKPSPNSSKNAWDRSPAEASDPTTSNGAPVPCDDSNVGTTDSCSCKAHSDGSTTRGRRQLQSCARNSFSRGKSKANFDQAQENSPVGCGGCKQRFAAPRSSGSCQGDRRRLLGQCDAHATSSMAKDSQRRQEDAHSCPRKHSTRLFRSCESISNSVNRLPENPQPRAKVEDSGYLSSTDSNGSHKRLLRHEVSSVSETDETESVCDGASESGAESVGTDSVFFGNFRRLSEFSGFPKSLDSGLEIGARNAYLHPYSRRNENGVTERTNFSTSDSEAESFVTVLPPCGTIREPV